MQRDIVDDVGFKGGIGLRRELGVILFLRAHI
jgi:hypothetical protein